MNINDPVRLYDGDWFSEGLITEIDPREGRVVVDFLDWVEQYNAADLRESYIYFKKIWLPTGHGTVLQDYR